MPLRRGTTVNPQIASNLLQRNVNLLRFEAGTRRRVLKMLDDMHVELLGKLASQNLTTFTKARTNALIGAAVDTIEGYYADIDALSKTALTGVAKTEASATASSLEKTYAVIDLSASLPTDTFIE